jgi:hypothetical protein
MQKFRKCWVAKKSSSIISELYEKWCSHCSLLTTVTTADLTVTPILSKNLPGAVARNESVWLPQCASRHCHRRQFCRARSAVATEVTGGSDLRPMGLAISAGLQQSDTGQYLAQYESGRNLKIYHVFKKL